MAISYTKLAKRDLARSGISWAEASYAGIVVEKSARSLVLSFESAPALVIPYWDVSGEDFLTYEEPDRTVRPFFRVRYLTKVVKKRHGKNRLIRYAQPPKSPVKPYFPRVRGLRWTEIINDREIPLIITEGEKKALSASLHGYPTIGLGGVWNFYDNGKLLPELDLVDWQSRDVFIIYDSDAQDNVHIQAAEARLLYELSSRGAIVRIGRIPASKTGEKVGIDDLLVTSGEDALASVIKKSKKANTLDKKVLDLNNSVAWIEEDNAILDLESSIFINKSSFLSGSKYSTLKHISLNAKGNVKTVSVAAEWLRHPLARRYDRVIFEPSIEHKEIWIDNSFCYNLWSGWPDVEPGDITPFLELHDYLFRYHDPSIKELVLDILASRAQYPGRKIPLALMFVSAQGAGKTTWANIVRRAFEPYSVEVSPRALRSEFNGWMEKSIIATINEVSYDDIRKKNDGYIRSIISDTKHMLNEKFRVAKQINNYSTLIFTTNERKAAVFAADDRRMIVVDAPMEKMPQDFFRKVYEWIEKGGPRHLLHYFLNRDISDFTIPAQAPMTPEKYMAYMESLTPVQRLAEECKTATQNIIIMWIKAALDWAEGQELSRDASVVKLAQQIQLALPRIQIRPWYTPEELSMIFPAIAHQLHNASLNTSIAGELSRQLREAGIPYLRNKDDPRGFLWRGRIQQYLVISEIDRWVEPIGQDEFEQLMREFPAFKELHKRG